MPSQRTNQPLLLAVLGLALGIGVLAVTLVSSGQVQNPFSQAGGVNEGGGITAAPVSPGSTVIPRNVTAPAAPTTATAPRDTNTPPGTGGASGNSCTRQGGRCTLSGCFEWERDIGHGGICGGDSRLICCVPSGATPTPSPGGSRATPFPRLTVTIPVNPTRPIGRLTPTPTGQVNPTEPAGTLTPTPPESGQDYTFSYQLDDNDWSDFTPDTSVTLSDLADGRYTFRVRARDAAGNIDASPAQRTFVVQTEGVTPTVTPTPPPGEPTSTPTPTTVPGQASLTFRARLEGRGTDRNAAELRLVARAKDFQLNRRVNARGQMEGEALGLDQAKFPPGQAQTFLLKTCGYLQSRQDVTLREGLNSVDFGVLKAGDVLGNDQYGGEIGDNEVNVLDYSRLVNLFESDDGCADFNGDGLVEVLDYSLMLNNFDVKGELFEE